MFYRRKNITSDIACSLMESKEKQQNTFQQSFLEWHFTCFLVMWVSMFWAYISSILVLTFLVDTGWNRHSIFMAACICQRRITCEDRISNPVLYANQQFVLPCVSRVSITTHNYWLVFVKKSALLNGLRTVEVAGLDITLWKDRRYLNDVYYRGSNASSGHSFVTFLLIG